MKNHSLRTIIFAASIGLYSTAWAGEVKTFSGGVGDDGLTEIQSMQSQYNLKVTFAGQGGIFLSDVQVKISNKKGEVLVDQSTDGPILLANLPAGQYTIRATVNDVVKSRTVIIKPHQQRSAGFTFPVTDDNQNYSLWRTLEDKGYQVSMLFG